METSTLLRWEGEENWAKLENEASGFMIDDPLGNQPQMTQNSDTRLIRYYSGTLSWFSDYSLSQDNTLISISRLLHLAKCDNHMRLGSIENEILGNDHFCWMRIVSVQEICRCIERGMAYDNRLVRFSVIISDRPGGMAELTKIIANVGASVKELTAVKRNSENQKLHEFSGKSLSAPGYFLSED